MIPVFRFGILLAIQALFSIAFPASAIAQGQANVLLILADDMGWGDLGCHGNDSVSTPNLDLLAPASVEFDRFYTNPLGAASRASLLTGRYALRTGVSGVAGRTSVLRAGEVTMAEVFRSAGYRTALFGKWANGQQYPNTPAGQGFDTFLGFYGESVSDYVDPQLVHDGVTVQPKGFITDILTDSAVQFLAGNRERPFFCFMSFNAPHSPLQCPDMYFDKYKSAGLSDRNAAIYGLIENLDANVGRLLHALDSLGLRDDTYVVFLSDNGPEGNRFNGGMRGEKASVYEGGIRVPCFIHRRNYLSPRHMAAPAAHIDLLPTLTGLCDLSLPGTLQPDGVNLSRIMQGAPDLPGNRMLFFHHANAGEVNGRRDTPYPGVVRAGRFALVLDEAGSPELFNLKTDPGQTTDLYESQEKIAIQLGEQYLNWFIGVTRSGTAPPPVPVGWPESPETGLPANEAQPGGSVHFHKGGQSNDWLEGWVDKRDTATWTIDVHTAGTYAVAIRYNCDSTFAGSRMRLVSSTGEMLDFNLDEASLSEEQHGPDRTPRREPGTKRWKTIEVGNIRLGNGPQTLLLLPYKPKGGMLEVKALLLKKT